MIATVSTVKDTLANVQRFVGGCLAGGVDHLIVFLDAPAPEVEAWLSDHPHVSHVVADEAWWGTGRSDDLNTRQRFHANIARSLLTRLSSIQWLFHVDADEIVQLDPSLLDGLGSDVTRVRLRPLEVVSQKHWAEDPVWFKRLLKPEELHLLEILGVLDKASNNVHFHGHVEGKVGMRPSLGEWLTLHRVVDADREPLDTYEHDALTLLHYESYSGEDFVRKWSTMLAPGTIPSLRKVRQNIAEAVAAVLGKDLPTEVRERYLMRVFERTTEDDFETLRDLDLLVRVDPREGAHRPATLPETEKTRLESMLQALSGRDKRAFRVCGPADEVNDVLDSLDGERPRRFSFRRS